LSDPRFYDVIIVGAGAAGIACAYELAKHRTKFLILEARPQLGGRIATVAAEASPVPIELGAEFIHGAPSSTLDFLNKFALPFYDVIDTHLYLKRGKLRPFPEFAARIEKSMKKLRAKGPKDRPVADFLATLKNVDADLRAVFTAYVEGFHGADLEKLGEQGLAASEQADVEDLNGSTLFRPTLGYTALLQSLVESINRPTAWRFATAVKHISWEPGQVQLQCADSTVYSCRKLVLTVPLGVLKSPALTWNKKPKPLIAALSALEVGHVQKIICCFRERFWEELQKNAPLAFMHTGPEFPFPTWWSLMPLREPRLTAWQGGPKALAMAMWPPEKILAAAMKTLAKITQRSGAFLQQQLTGFHTHNWSTDPYALGAYSYVSVGGVKAASAFTKPVAETIWFAGEATVNGASRATVNGALASGQRAAREVLR